MAKGRLARAMSEVFGQQSPAGFSNLKLTTQPQAITGITPGRIYRLQTRGPHTTYLAIESSAPTGNDSVNAWRIPTSSTFEFKVPDGQVAYVWSQTGTNQIVWQEAPRQ